MYGAFATHPKICALTFVTTTAYLHALTPRLKKFVADGGYFFGTQYIVKHLSTKLRHVTCVGMTIPAFSEQGAPGDDANSSSNTPTCGP